MADGAQKVNEDTVEALLDNVRHFLKNADDLGTSLHSRGSTLVSFGGIIISIVAFLHRDEARSFGLSGWGAVPAVLALIFLLAATVIVISFVLIPTRGRTIGLSEIQGYPTYAYVMRSRVDVQGTTLRGLVEALEIERARNKRKAQSLRIAFIALLLGLVFVTVDAVVLATEDRCDGGRTGQLDSCSQRHSGYPHTGRESGRSCPG